MTDVLKYLLIAVVAYLLGSFSTGLTVAKATHGPNLYEVGSKNTGATNALRTMGLKRGLATFLGDVLKALIACALGKWLLGQNGAMLAGLMVIIGHNWPVFHHFKGGKGVACSCAVMLLTFPIPAIISFVVAILTIVISRYVSLGSVVLLLLFSILVAVTNWGCWLAIVWALLLAALCVYRHRANIGRLLRGEENKFSVKK
ncbi:MAG: glycerol-3-phosphate 1-O-acyltransferase PlsY [Clostridia bacterium]|nr:glycerol-3-phosphate 1-O-acyltransferase PlsY [Clostridia bacterium]